VRIDQFVPSFVKHDAISNHVLQSRRALLAAGYESAIFYEHCDRRLVGEASPFEQCDPGADPDRLILYHASTDSEMAGWLLESAAAGQAVAISYHNITPSRYFARWEPRAAKSMQTARVQLAELAPVTCLALADSAYNAAELDELGYRRTAVTHLMLDLADYHRPPDAKTLSRLGALGGPRWVFIGRIAPNKCQHDVMAAFAVYRRLYAPGARLSLVGAVTSPRYRRALEAMAAELELGDSVEFVDSAPFPELLAHLRAADVFVCLSEHEGFCVPIVEAMELGVPVVGFAAAAVPETIGDAGLVLPDKDPLAVAASVHALLVDERLRNQLIQAGRERAGEFAMERTAPRLVAELAGFRDQVGRPG
jgi:glycosyltransferase involved in cell wall biosynthesis